MSLVVTMDRPKPVFLVALVTSLVCLLCPTWCTEVGRVEVQFAVLDKLK